MFESLYFLIHLLVEFKTVSREGKFKSRLLFKTLKFLHTNLLVVQVISETWPSRALLGTFLTWKKYLVVRARKPGLLNILFTSMFYLLLCKNSFTPDEQSDKNKEINYTGRLLISLFTYYLYKDKK